MNQRSFIVRNDFVRNGVLAFIAKMPFDWEVICRPFVEKRSLEQNARLWMLHSKAASETGHSAEEMHEFALMRHFGTKEISVGGLTRLVPLKRSSARNRKEFTEFMESTEAWYIAELGVYLDQQAA